MTSFCALHVHLPSAFILCFARSIAFGVHLCFARSYVLAKPKKKRNQKKKNHANPINLSDRKIDTFLPKSPK